MTITTKKTFQEAEKHYSQLRQDAYTYAEREFQNTLNLPITVTSISLDAIIQAAMWATNSQAAKVPYLSKWNWEKELKKFKRRPRRVEVAIWHGVTLLCGLALGRVSDRYVVATIHFIEANPTKMNPLSGQIARLITRFLEIYAVNL
jgi:hypothetical protein